MSELVLAFVVLAFVVVTISTLTGWIGGRNSNNGLLSTLTVAGLFSFLIPIIATCVLIILETGDTEAITIVIFLSFNMIVSSATWVIPFLALSTLPAAITFFVSRRDI